MFRGSLWGAGGGLELNGKYQTSGNNFQCHVGPWGRVCAQRAHSAGTART